MSVKFHVRKNVQNRETSCKFQLSGLHSVLSCFFLFS